MNKGDTSPLARLLAFLAAAEAGCCGSPSNCSMPDYECDVRDNGDSDECCEREGLEPLALSDEGLSTGYFLMDLLESDNVPCEVKDAARKALLCYVQNLVDE
jgi:hypothetical protein